MIKESYGNFIDDKKQFQSEVQSIENILRGKQKNVFNLDNLKPVQVIDLEFPEDTESNEFECDILYEKCKQVCILINEPSEPILNHSISSPFEILKDSSIIEKILKCVEYNKIDFTNTFQHLKTDTSPFTRKKLKGVFVLHNGDVNVWKLIRYNAKAMSIMYGKGLLGNYAVWSVVFLYLIAKYHTAWKEHQNILFDEIRYIAENVTTYITLSPYINPNINVKMSLALWYIVNVSSKAFPQSEKNILRTLGKPFYEFYTDVYRLPVSVSKNTIDMWTIWKWMRTQNNVEQEVMTQFQHHKRLDGEHLIFLEGPGRRHGFLKHFTKEIILKTLRNLNKNSLPYQYLDKNVSGEYETILVQNNEKIFEEHRKEIGHIIINVKTGHSLVTCPHTGRHWKECANPMENIKRESYVRVFASYCNQFKSYPKSFNDLWLYHANKYGPIVYNEELFSWIFSSVFTLYEEVMNTMDCKTFLKLRKKYGFNQKMRMEEDEKFLNDFKHLEKLTREMSLEDVGLSIC